MSFLIKMQDLLDQTRRIDFLGPVALRIYLGLIFVASGMTKTSNIAGIAYYFEGLGIPMPLIMAYVAGYTELLGGIALLVGVGVRWVSAPLMIMMLVAAFTEHWWTEWEEPMQSIVAIQIDGKNVESINEGQKGTLILDDTPFAAHKDERTVYWNEEGYSVPASYEGNKEAEVIPEIITDTGRLVSYKKVVVDKETNWVISREFIVEEVKDASQGEVIVRQHIGYMKSGSLNTGRQVEPRVALKTFAEHWQMVAQPGMESHSRISGFKSYLEENNSERYNYSTARGNITILNNGIEYAMTLFAMLLILFFVGGGRYVSVDYWIAKKFNRID